MRNTAYRPPFPYFGGKSPVAHLVWQALGNPTNYVEPFFGSGAVLFLRPHAPGIETVNDADGLLANFWRALRADPDAVAEHADNPVNECDLHARHLWLVGQRERLTERLMGDPDFYDARADGYWCWGACCWIGNGWCSGKGPWVVEDGQMVRAPGAEGVRRKIPHLGNAGRGVQRERPHLGDAGRGVCAAHRKGLRSYLQGFAERLRRVRVCCGDWTRVCSPCVMGYHGLTGIFLDPPYGTAANRDGRLYACDSQTVAAQAQAWAITQGEDPQLRIVFAGYEGEHQFPPTWRQIGWQTSGGYGNQDLDEDGPGRVNRGRERLWLSPHCLVERTLFELSD